MNKQQIVEIRTVEQLRSFLSTVLEREITDQNLIWGNALYNASLALQSFSAKDLASMMMDGITAINMISDVQDTINTFFEDVENGDVHCLVEYMLGQQYGRHDLASIVGELFEEEPSDEEMDDAN